jgi:hypothetical protein
MNKDEILKQIDTSINLYKEARPRAQYDDLSGLGDTETTSILTRLAATIDRLAPDGSRYKQNAHAAFKKIRRDTLLQHRTLIGDFKSTPC